MSFLFEFLNIHISHLAQLIIIDIMLKCQNKNICKKVCGFHHYLTWFLDPLNIFASFHAHE